MNTKLAFSFNHCLTLVQFRTGPMTDGIKRCWCMHSTMVCATVCFISSGFGPVRNCISAHCLTHDFGIVEKKHITTPVIFHYQNHMYILFCKCTGVHTSLRKLQIQSRTFDRETNCSRLGSAEISENSVAVCCDACCPSRSSLHGHSNFYVLRNWFSWTLNANKS